MNCLKKVRIFAAIFFVMLFFISSCEGETVSASNKSGVCTFSAISGHIYNQGKPVTNAKVIRTTDWQKKKVDETTTDDNGYFEMPAVFESSIANILPMEFVVAQTIEVVVDGVAMEFWSGVKRKKTENAEGQGNEVKVKCELSNDRVAIRVDGQPFITSCEWDVSPDKPMTIEDFLGTNND